MQLRPLTLLLTLALLLGGCGSDSSSSNATTDLIENNTPQNQDTQQPVDTNTTTDDTDTTSAFDTAQKSYMYALMLDEYYWYDEVPVNVDTSGFDTPEAMLDALKYDALDRWSYIESPQEYEDYVNQSASGFGCLFYYPNATVTEVQLDSPCDIAGVLRGDVITHVNGELVTSQNYSAAATADGVTSTFTVERGGFALDLDITAAPYTYSVVNRQIITLPDNTKVGHLIYDGFVSSSYDNLDETFTLFKSQGVSELIVDLRYNGGGSLLMASILLDWIAGVANEDQLQFSLEWNDKNSYENSAYVFYNEPNSLNLERIVFINTEFTASASEAVINALEPYTNVVNIGTTTHGKPVGFQGKQNGDFIYWLVNFAVYNANGEGDYYGGIAPDCGVVDTVAYPRTNENDPMLAEALYYLENDTCSF